MKMSLEMLVGLAKRRGFVWQASEIYGGISGFYNYGPYGVQLMRNVKESWWNAFVRDQPNIVGLDGSIIQHPKLWEASGHVGEFTDPLVECKKCKHRFREDDVDMRAACPRCGERGSFVKPRQFNLMFETAVGAVKKDSSTTYLRPETAGPIFTDFELVRQSARLSIPFGIAQVGKAFRNEISPRDFLFRMREFEQAELEYFVRPENAPKEFNRWLKFCEQWLIGQGVDKEKISKHEHADNERSHYSAKTVDIMYKFPFGKKELMGIANRTDFDLKAQSKGSEKTLEYFDQNSGKKYVPYIIEPSLGLDRLFLTILDSAYHEEEVKGERRVVLKLPYHLAPVKVAVLPLSKNAKLSPLAKKIYTTLKQKYYAEYDETQSIGRRYRRQDEIGTPLCVTIDFESLKDNKVTLRNRDSMRQERVAISKLSEQVQKKLK